MIKSEVERARREDEKAGRESMVDRVRFFSAETRLSSIRARMFASMFLLKVLNASPGRHR